MANVVTTINSAMANSDFYNTDDRNYSILNKSWELNDSCALDPHDDSEQPMVLYKATPEVVAVLAVFYGCISLLALVGNGLVVLIIVSNKRMQSVTNFLLANLASSDILIAAAAVPFQFQAALLQRWVLPDFMCIVAPFVQVITGLQL